MFAASNCFHLSCVFFFLRLKGHFNLEGFLEPTDFAHNSRFGSAMSSMPDLNGDGYGELVVGAPLENDHGGAIYLFYSRRNGIQSEYKQVELKAFMGFII